MNSFKDRFLTATLGALAAIVIVGGIAWLVSAASSKIVESPKIEKDYKARGSGREEDKTIIFSSKDEKNDGGADEEKKRQKTEVATMED